MFQHGARRRNFADRLSRVVIVLILLAASTGLTRAQTVTNKFQGEIDAFLKADRTNAPAPGGILFVGSSSFRLWTSLPKMFRGFPIINRGFGGSQISDVIEFTPKIVIPYQPKQIFLYGGDNDLASGKTPEKVFADFKEFVKIVRKELPETPVHFVSIKPSPARVHLLEKARAANKLIQEFAAQEEKVEYVDVFSSMLKDDGQPDPSLFVEDNLHLNEKGYALWARLIGPTLRR